MHGSRIPIWFFIGLLLTIYGAMILGYGIFESATARYAPGVELAKQLHTPIWWGGVLLLLGLVYVVKFRPGKKS